MFFLGIDGGGSKTTCVVGDENHVLGSGVGGGSNIVRVGEDAARAALSTAIHQACAAANVEPAQIHRACIGIAGAARSEIRAAIREMVAPLLGGELQIVGDMGTALEAAFSGGPGVVTIAGTGSIAFGRNAGGETARVGGWGFEISDEGSGHWIGRTALNAALRARDEGETPKFLERARAVLGVPNDEQLILKANGSADFASLFPAVLERAEAGDLLASRILSDAGDELARLAKLAIARLFHAIEKVPVAMAGGVFRNSAFVRQVFYNSVRAGCPAAEVQAAVIEPVQGALALARRGAST